MDSITARIAAEVSAQPQQVQAAIALLDEGATVPFIARYRKEMTGGLDDTQLRQLETRLIYLRELEARRDTILNSIREQDKLTDELEQAILAADSKTTLEDLYLPYKPKRRTKAQIAREAGLQPLADGLLTDPSQDPEIIAADYLNPEHKIDSKKDALDGAKQILMEQFAEDAQLLQGLRTLLWEQGELRSQLPAGTAAEQALNDAKSAKFKDYFEYMEPLAKIPSHRALALFRGRNENVLHLKLELPEHQQEEPESRIAARFGVQNKGRPADAWLTGCVNWAWKIKLSLKLEIDLLMQLREQAEADAIKVFATNMKDLLLAAPAGPKATMGLDPGLRTGVKVAVVDATGKMVDTATIYPHVPKKKWQDSLATLAGLVNKHQVQLIAIGNGTGSRETDKLAAELVAGLKTKVQKIMVSEAGASVYSASELASKEFPDLDVSLRGAVSIARRLQDPLAELVKIEPKSIGVGQYQHDVNQGELGRSLDGVVEDCVNGVGVDLNTASAPLLTRVAGLSATMAENVITYRDEHGAFNNRKQLLKVPRLGPRSFEQAAGFLRINASNNPLDASAVHPESYPLVQKIADHSGLGIEGLVGNQKALKAINAKQFVDEQFGLPTIKDILAELEKPGRDPRPEFKAAEFADGVETLADLKEGMKLEGAVTNVTNFGAFVDIGVHQDGLVHISQLADRYVDDAHKVVKAGDIVKVRVLEVDPKRKRIALSMRSEDKSNAGDQRPAAPAKKRTDSARKARPAAKPRNNAQPANGAMADALRKAMSAD